MISTVGLYHPQKTVNVGGVLRAAEAFGVDLIITEGDKKTWKQSSNVSHAEKRIPIIEGVSLIDSIPFGCVPIAVEICEGSISLPKFQHPKNAFYIFGPEHSSIPKRIMDRCAAKVSIPTKICLNLACCVNVVLYDRISKL